MTFGGPPGFPPRDASKPPPVIGSDYTYSRGGVVWRCREQSAPGVPIHAWGGPTPPSPAASRRDGFGAAWPLLRAPGGLCGASRPPSGGAGSPGTTNRGGLGQGRPLPEPRPQAVHQIDAGLMRHGAHLLAVRLYPADKDPGVVPQRRRRRVPPADRARGHRPDSRSDMARSRLLASWRRDGGRPATWRAASLMADGVTISHAMPNARSRNLLTPSPPGSRAGVLPRTGA